jgi:D-alanyl-lipoteichoic acid acyltransferase DltB (MBOAT superfamily)
VKIEGMVFSFMTVFFLAVTPIYWYMSYDPTGTTALALTFGLSALVSFYLLYTSRKVHPRPEDRKDGEIEEMAGEYGFYSPHSWWPLACAGSAAIVFLGLVFAWWLFIVGAALGTGAVLGMVFEYYRGEFAH